jgi:hypothetical protein
MNPNEREREGEREREMQRYVKCSIHAMYDSLGAQKKEIFLPPPSDSSCIMHSISDFMHAFGRNRRIKWNERERERERESHLCPSLIEELVE